MRLLGLDVGTVRIGVAVSDPLGSFAQPLEVIDRRRTPVAARLVSLVHTYEVELLVVGRPLQLDGRAGLAVQATERFVAELTAPLSEFARQCPLARLAWWDERLTTAQAERVMISGGVRRASRRQQIDKVAAALLLQSYMDAQARPCA